MTRINRLISSVILVACFPIMAILPSHSGSLLFIFISGNKWVSTGRLALAIILFALSFGYVRPKSRKPMLWAGLGLIGFGIISLLTSSFGYFLYDYIKILDVMVLMEAGVILCALSIELSSQPKLAAKSTSKSSKKGTKARAVPA